MLCKAGLCIDVGKDVWSHYWNDWIGAKRMKDSKRFATAAIEVLKKYQGKDLPEKHQCKDGKHLYPDAMNRKDGAGKVKVYPMKDESNNAELLSMF